MYLLETTNRPSYEAALFAGHYNSTGLCLSFAYAMLGDGVGTNLLVVAYREDKKAIVISNITAKLYDTRAENGRWFYDFRRLPPGLNLLVVTGKRSAHGKSGIAMDDMIVSECGQTESQNGTEDFYVQSSKGCIARAVTQLNASQAEKEGSIADA
jgi:hypothetical protein